jgi:hypothetical protein
LSEELGIHHAALRLEGNDEGVVASCTKPIVVSAACDKVSMGDSVGHRQELRVNARLGEGYGVSGQAVNSGVVNSGASLVRGKDRHG